MFRFLNSNLCKYFTNEKSRILTCEAFAKDLQSFPFGHLDIFPFLNYKPNNNKNAIIKPNNAIASTKAKPKIVYVNKVFNNKGFLEIAIKKEPNTLPIPIPAPIRDIVAKPAAIIFADNKIIIK